MDQAGLVPLLLYLEAMIVHVSIPQQASASCLPSALSPQVHSRNVTPHGYGGILASYKGEYSTFLISVSPDSLFYRTPSFQGVIPGGNSFSVPQSSLTTVPEQGLGFDWKPSVRAGTTVILTGGDDRGLGTAGSSVFIVNPGSNDCLSDASPSSTPGSPAGGSYPTSTSGAGIGGSSGGG